MTTEQAIAIVTRLLDSKVQQSDEIEACLLLIDLLSKQVAGSTATHAMDFGVLSFRD